MGFFKSIGSKLKRAVSIKNLGNIVTGNFGAVGKEVIRVATTTNQGKDENGRSIITNDLNGESKQFASTNTMQDYVAPPALPSVLETVLQNEGQKLVAKTTAKLAENDAVQNVASSAINLTVSAYWNKYKNWLIGFIIAVLLFFGVRKLFFQKSKRSAKR